MHASLDRWGMGINGSMGLGLFKDTSCSMVLAKYHGVLSSGGGHGSQLSLKQVLTHIPPCSVFLRKHAGRMLLYTLHCLVWALDDECHCYPTITSLSATSHLTYESYPPLWLGHHSSLITRQPATGWNFAGFTTRPIGANGFTTRPYLVGGS